MCMSTRPPRHPSPGPAAGSQPQRAALTWATARERRGRGELQLRGEQAAREGKMLRLLHPLPTTLTQPLLDTHVFRVKGRHSPAFPTTSSALLSKPNTVPSSARRKNNKTPIFAPALKSRTCAAGGGWEGSVCTQVIPFHTPSEQAGAKEEPSSPRGAVFRWGSSTTGWILFCKAKDSEQAVLLLRGKFSKFLQETRSKYKIKIL